MKIDKISACAVTGHREITEEIDVEKIKSVFYKLIESGKTVFLVGMALGFDTLCFNLLEQIREEKKIKIIACIPCDTQSEKFSYKDKSEYERMLKSADKKIYVSREYTPYCMFKRNMFMVDNSSVLVAYKRKEAGGTARTVKYAEKQGCMVIEL